MSAHCEMDLINQLNIPSYSLIHMNFSIGSLFLRFKSVISSHLFMIL